MDYRTIDPLFAMSVGTLAAVVRINREEKEKGFSREETVASLRRRVGGLFEGGSGGEEKMGKVVGEIVDGKAR